MPGSSFRRMGEQGRLRVGAPGGGLGGSVREHHSQSVYSLASCPSTPMFVANSPGDAFVTTRSPGPLEHHCLICMCFQSQLTCVSRRAGTLVSVDLVDALAIVTWVALTVIQIDLTINT